MAAAKAKFAAGLAAAVQARLFSWFDNVVRAIAVAAVASLFAVAVAVAAASAAVDEGISDKNDSSASNATVWTCRGIEK